MTVVALFARLLALLALAGGIATSVAIQHNALSIPLLVLAPYPALALLFAAVHALAVRRSIWPCLPATLGGLTLVAAAGTTDDRGFVRGVDFTSVTGVAPLALCAALAIVGGLLTVRLRSDVEALARAVASTTSGWSLPTKLAVAKAIAATTTSFVAVLATAGIWISGDRTTEALLGHAIVCLAVAVAQVAIPHLTSCRTLLAGSAVLAVGWAVMAVLMIDVVLGMGEPALFAAAFALGVAVLRLVGHDRRGPWWAIAGATVAVLVRFVEHQHLHVSNLPGTSDHLAMVVVSGFLLAAVGYAREAIVPAPGATATPTADERALRFVRIVFLVLMFTVLATTWMTSFPWYGVELVAAGKVPIKAVALALGLIALAAAAPGRARRP